MRALPALLLAAIAAGIAGCASQPLPPGTELPGFWWGLWHGFFAPIALVVGIFTDVRIYEYPNSGGWYDFGFLLGVSPWGCGASYRARQRRRKRDDEIY